MEPKRGMDTFIAKEVAFVDQLKIGHDGNTIVSQLKTPEQRENFAVALRGHTKPLTIIKSADCMDDRPTLRLGDDTTDLEVLKKRIVRQLPGGTGLAITKAAIAADLALVKGTKDIKAAYELVYQWIVDNDYEDGGHAGCGASKFVEASVSEPVAPEIALPTLGAIMAVNESRTAAFQTNATTKDHRLQDGFYSTWDPAWHQEFLMAKAPHNFSFLDETHKADAVYLITGTGSGFAKNEFTEDTHQEAFGVTVSMMEELAVKLGNTEEERDRLRVGFAIDLLDVSDKLVAPGLPVFADAA